jgi:putative endonuclease
LKNPHNRELGTGGEDAAAAFLISKNFSIIERNFRYGKTGEIDIIARRGDLVVFVEVKSRSSARYGGALYSIGSKKKASLKKAAGAFIASRPEYNRKELTFRFDLISVTAGSIDWLEDMFR